jgi:hypothetical protein
MTKAKRQDRGNYKVQGSGCPTVYFVSEIEARQFSSRIVGTDVFRLQPKTDGSGYEWIKMPR